MALKKLPDLRRFAWESTKSQKWETTSQRSASGRMRTLTNQLYPNWTITASYNCLTDAEARQLHGFAASVKGGFEPFLWLDPEDYQEKGRPLAALDGTRYQATMKLGEHVEPVEYIENVAVYVDGIRQNPSSYSIDAGVVKFKTTPAGTVTADYTYYWRVHFADDGLEIEKIFQDANKASLTLEVVR